MSLATKVFAITGGASGMGASTCRLLAEKGAGVICVGDLESKGFAELQQSISKINPSTKVHCKTLDVSSSESVDEWIRDIVATFGDLHGAANVAGLPQAIGVRKIPAILEETDEAWDRILGVNLNGIFYCTRAEVRAMKQLPQGSRAIVNVASMASLQHNPDIYAYRTSKAACAHFTTSVAKDTNDLGIRINAVSPGVTDTPMLGKFIPSAASSTQIQQGWKSQGWNHMSAEDVGRVIVWLLSEESRPVYGSNINVGAGLP